MSNKDKLWITADNHISASVPKCRVETEEEWISYQKDLMLQVKELVGDDLLINAGDVIDFYNPYKTNVVTNAIIDCSPKNHVLIGGNHCCMGISQDMERALQTGALGVLARSNSITYLNDSDTFEWGDYVIHPSNFKNGRFGEHRDVDPNKINILMGHFLCFPDVKPSFIKEGTTAKEFLKEYIEYDYAFIGDYHDSYLVDNKFLSPGSLTRRTASQMEHKPCIWSLEAGKFTQHFLKVPLAEEVISREHLDKKEAKEGRFDDWAESVENSDIEDLDIESSLHSYFLKNEARKNTKDLILSLVEEVK